MNFSDRHIDSEARLNCRVFRTSLQNKQAVESISEVLNHLPGIQEWSVDLDDREKVLRVECIDLSAETIIEVLQNEGVDIQKLPVDRIKF